MTSDLLPSGKEAGGGGGVCLAQSVLAVRVGFKDSPNVRPKLHQIYCSPGGLPQPLAEITQQNNISSHPSPASPPGLSPAWLARGRLEAPSEFSFPPRSRPCRPSPPVPTGSLLRKWSPARTGHWCDGSETRHNYNNTQHSLQNLTFSLSQLPMAGLSPTPAQTIYGQNYFDRALTSQPCREETFAEVSKGSVLLQDKEWGFLFLIASSLYLYMGLKSWSFLLLHWKPQLTICICTELWVLYSGMLIGRRELC